MGFLNWWFGDDEKNGAVKASPTAGDFAREVVNLPEFRPVPKWTRAGKNGKEIFCPKCSGAAQVYSFSWSMRGCGHCKARVKKYDWLLRS
jgi:hypothetical protein